MSGNLLLLLPAVRYEALASDEENHPYNFRSHDVFTQALTEAKMKRSMAQIEESVARYLNQLESADRQECSRARAMKIDRLNDKISTLQGEV